MGMFGSEWYGGAPDTPPFIPVNAQVEQRRAITGNLAAQPDIETLASRYNQFNWGQINEALGATDPFKDQIATQLSKNRLNWSKGIMSKDLADLVQYETAARSVSGGYGGTGMHDAALARNYGLTSFALQKEAQSAEESWLKTAAGIYEPAMFNVGSMMISPQQQIALAVEERDKKFQRDYVANQWDWYDSFGQKATRFDQSLTIMTAAIGGTVAGMFSGGGGMGMGG